MSKIPDASWPVTSKTSGLSRRKAFERVKPIGRAVLSAQAEMVMVKSTQPGGTAWRDLLMGEETDAPRRTKRSSTLYNIVFRAALDGTCLWFGRKRFDL